MWATYSSFLACWLVSKTRNLLILSRHHLLTKTKTDTSVGSILSISREISILWLELNKPHKLETFCLNSPTFCLFLDFRAWNEINEYHLLFTIAIQASRVKKTSHHLAVFVASATASATDLAECGNGSGLFFLRSLSSTTGILSSSSNSDKEVSPQLGIKARAEFWFSSSVKPQTLHLVSNVFPFCPIFLALLGQHLPTFCDVCLYGYLSKLSAASVLIYFTRCYWFHNICCRFRVSCTIILNFKLGSCKSNKF